MVTEVCEDDGISTNVLETSGVEALKVSEQPFDEQSDPQTSRGQKRPLHEEGRADPSTETNDLEDAMTFRGGLPDGVSVTWVDNGDALATFSRSEGALNTTTEEKNDEDTETTLRICIVGRARIQCLEGQAEILGHVLNPDSKEISISSPFWTSWLTIHVPIQASQATKLKFSSVRGAPSFRLASPTRPTVIPANWKSCVDQICDDFSSTPPATRDSIEEDAPFVHSKDQIVMICGAKGVGKSTLLRYMTNRLLQAYPQNQHEPTVAILDADVGQPELAPPGMLYLSLQDVPLLHQPYWNLCGENANKEKSIASIYYGAVTSKVDPTRYISEIQRLVQEYRNYLSQSPNNVPLIVNLDGWIKGMGFEILSTLISSTKPSHVCQLFGQSRARTFDLSEVIAPTVCNAAVDSHPEHYFLDICNKHVNPLTIPSSSLRTLRYGAYFGSHLVDLWDSLDALTAKQLQTGWSDDEECTLAHYLASEKPFCVPFEAVQCVHSNIGVSEELTSELSLLKALNGSLVGLCTENQRNCLGLGIVRSIDWANRLFYILTPVRPEKLVSVKTFVAGNIPLPPPLIYRGVNAESFPYMTNVYTTMAPLHQDGNNGQNNKILGSDPMKSRNNIIRRSQLGPPPTK